MMAMLARPTSWLAISTRRMPWLCAACTWGAFASVMPQAPPSIWRWNRAGLMVVLPCGASLTR